MNTSEQTGFNALGIVVLVALVIAVGLMAWYGVTQRKAQVPTANTQTGNVAQTDTNTGYVVIKEWDVRFKPVKGLVGVIYKNSSAASVALTTEALAALSPNCSGSASGFTALGVLERTTQPKEHSELYLGDVNGYHYYYAGPQAACTQNPANTDLELTSKQKMKASITSIEAAK